MRAAAAETAYNTIAEDDVDGDNAIVEDARNRYDHAVRPTHHARESDRPTERRLIMSLNGEDQQEEEAAAAATTATTTRVNTHTLPASIPAEDHIEDENRRFYLGGAR